MGLSPFAYNEQCERGGVILGMNNVSRKESSQKLITLTGRSPHRNEQHKQGGVFSGMNNKTAVKHTCKQHGLHREYSIRK